MKNSDDFGLRVSISVTFDKCFWLKKSYTRYTYRNARLSHHFIKVMRELVLDALVLVIVDGLQLHRPSFWVLRFPPLLLLLPHARLFDARCLLRRTGQQLRQ